MHDGNNFFVYIVAVCLNNNRIRIFRKIIINKSSYRHFILLFFFLSFEQFHNPYLLIKYFEALIMRPVYKKRSVVWEHFKKHVNNKIVTCKICKKE